MPWKFLVSQYAQVFGMIFNKNPSKPFHIFIMSAQNICCSTIEYSLLTFAWRTHNENNFWLSRFIIFDFAKLQPLGIEENVHFLVWVKEQHFRWNNNQFLWSGN